MPNNKYIINESQLVDIADAIRTKLNEQDTYTVDEMPGKIESIESNSPIIYIPEQAVILSSSAPHSAEITGVTLDPDNPVESIPLSLEGEGQSFNFTLNYGVPPQPYDFLGNVYYITEPTFIAVFYNYGEGKWYFILPDSAPQTEVTISSIVEDSGGGSDLFKTVELTITLSGGASYDLIAPAFYTEDGDNFIISIDENLEDAENVFNIIIPTNGSAYIKIIPSAGANVFIDSGDITQAGANSYTITGNAEVAVLGK